jgi:hypothetical protein
VHIWISEEYECTAYPPIYCQCGILCVRRKEGWQVVRMHVVFDDEELRGKRTI